MKKRHFQEILPADFGSLLLAPELLNSLLIKLKMILNNRITLNKDMLKRLSSDFSFLNNLDMTSIEQLMLLANYTDLPIHMAPLTSMNMLEFLIAFKSRAQPYHHETDFNTNLCKILN